MTDEEIQRKYDRMIKEVEVLLNIHTILTESMFELMHPENMIIDSEIMEKIENLQKEIVKKTNLRKLEELRDKWDNED